MNVPLASRPATLIGLAATAVVWIVPVGVGIAAPLDQDLQVTRQRPLFTPGRRPPPQPTQVAPVDAASPVPTDPLPTFAVRGIVVGDHRRFAIVQRSADTRPVSLSVGSELDGWTVDEIRPRGITVRHGTRTVTLIMSTARP